MTSKSIEKLLRHALIDDGKMVYALYEYELQAALDEWMSSLAQDNDDFVFTVTENSGDVAMVLIEKTGDVYINEQARDKLKLLWLGAYKSNMNRLIPYFAKQLANGEIPINGVKTAMVV
jgi:hypothetical protein